MAKCIGRFKKGKMTLAVIKGSFTKDGKTVESTSFTISKSVLKDGKWEKSDFLSITDIQDVQTLAARLLSDYVKYQKVEPKPEPESQPEEYGGQDEPQF